MQRALCALVLLVTDAALAQDAPRAVVLRVPDCLEVSGSAVKELVALELAPRMQMIDASAEPALTAAVQCEESTAVLTVEDPARATPLRVELDLAAAASLARPRLLALTLAELITTSQLEQPVPAAEPAPVAQPEAAQAEPDDDGLARAAPPLQLWVSPSLSIAGAPVLPLLGGEVGLSYALGPVLLALEGQARFAQNDRAASDISLRALSAGFAVMPLLIDRGAQLALGAGARVGHVSVTATSHDPRTTGDSLSGIWLGPMAAASLHLPFVDAVALRFALEAGYFARPTIGRDQLGAERFALRGPWLSLGAGIALGL
jgi:hypothetical protein